MGKSNPNSPATEKQREFLMHLGYPPAVYQGELSKLQASSIIDEYQEIRYFVFDVIKEVYGNDDEWLTKEMENRIVHIILNNASLAKAVKDAQNKRNIERYPAYPEASETDVFNPVLEIITNVKSGRAHINGRTRASAIGCSILLLPSVLMLIILISLLH